MTEYRNINKIIIIGMGSSWQKAPMEGETWGLNSLILRRPVKRLFLMHDIDVLLESLPQFNLKGAIEEVNKLGIPVMVHKKHKLIPNSVEFPLNDMPSRYFTSSFAYMIAYAIHVGATAIDLYGVPLTLKVEYQEQKCCIEYWLGYARGKGIEITIYGLTTLFGTGTHAGLYGYEWTQEYQKIP